VIKLVSSAGNRLSVLLLLSILLIGCSDNPWQRTFEGTSKEHSQTIVDSQLYEGSRSEEQVRLSLSETVEGKVLLTVEDFAFEVDKPTRPFRLVIAQQKVTRNIDGVDIVFRVEGELKMTTKGQAVFYLQGSPVSGERHDSFGYRFEGQVVDLTAAPE
jgi:hypothetical protein